MNRTKQEAIRVKEVAEKMILSADYMGARDKLLQAQKICPSLENLLSMLTVCDVLSAASIRFPGSGVDYYWVLQLRPSASEFELKTQFQKIVSLLDLVKNQFPGTELALKLVKDSFFMLSDRDKRGEFDLKRVESWDNCGVLYTQVAKRESSVGVTAESSCVDKRVEVEISDESNVQDGQRGRASGFDSERGSIVNNDIDMEKITNPQEGNWGSSQGQGEVSRGRIAGGAEGTMSSLMGIQQSSSLSSKIVSPKKVEMSFYNFENSRKDEVFEVGQVWAAHFRAKVAQRYARINSRTKFELGVTWLKPVPFTQDERSWCEAGFPVACGSFELELETSEVKLNGPKIFSQLCSWVHGVTEEQFDVYPKAGEVWAVYQDWDLSDWLSNPDSMKKCKFKIVEILTDYSMYLGTLVGCLVKVEGFRSVYRRDTEEENESIFSIIPSNLYMFSHKIPAFRFMGGEMDGVVDGMFELDPMGLPYPNFNLKILEEDGSSNISSFTHPPADPADFPPISSNSNTQPLKLNWSVSNFSAGQVWAIYCGNDAMPRRYTLINGVVSENQVRVTFLEPHPILDHEINWEKENLPIACGIFKTGKTMVNLPMSSFSHLVKGQRSTDHNFYKVYPRKGEIWAMYRYWNKKWNQFNFNNYQCRVVEILSDFTEENGMKISRMVEVKGCMTFFQKHRYDGFELTRTVSKTEMLSFSHRIPAFTVPGIERYGIPESSLHLEPDALPPRLGANFHPLS